MIYNKIEKILHTKYNQYIYNINNKKLNSNALMNNLNKKCMKHLIKLNNLIIN